MESRVIVSCFADVMRDVCEQNEQLAPSSHPLAKEFFLIGSATMSLTSYMLHLFSVVQGGHHECFVVAAIFLDRLRRHADFLLQRSNSFKTLLTCLLVASKVLEDGGRRNLWYASHGGVPLARLNTLEIALLVMMKWDVHVDAHEYDRYLKLFVPRARVPTPLAPQHPQQKTGATASVSCRSSVQYSSSSSSSTGSSHLMEVYSLPDNCSHHPSSATACSRNRTEPHGHTHADSRAHVHAQNLPVQSRFAAASSSTDVRRDLPTIEDEEMAIAVQNTTWVTSVSSQSSRAAAAEHLRRSRVRLPGVRAPAAAATTHQLPRLQQQHHFDADNRPYSPSTVVEESVVEHSMAEMDDVEEIEDANAAFKEHLAEHNLPVEDVFMQPQAPQLAVSSTAKRARKGVRHKPLKLASPTASPLATDVSTGVSTGVSAFRSSTTNTSVAFLPSSLAGSAVPKTMWWMEPTATKNFNLQ